MQGSWIGRLVWLLVGLALYGLALAAMVQASIGLDPWSVLSEGVAHRLGLSFGAVTDLIGLLVLALWIPLRQRPGLGTVLNVLLIGPAADVGIWLVPSPHAYAARLLLFLGGVLVLGCATGIYIAPSLGPGPRDGLMTGLSRRTGWPIVRVRTGIELTVLAVGWLLGGQVGPGTIIEAVLIGAIVHRTLPFFGGVIATRPRLVGVS